MMKVYIWADMEGVTDVTGVTHPDDVIPGRPQYERFRRFLTADVNAAIDGAGRAGASDFLINEALDGMRNIVLENLDPRAESIVGQRKPLMMIEGVEDADVAFFVGYHARAGVEGVLSHTYGSSTEVIRLELNGEPCSEARVNAALAGSLGIPVGLVTGDDRARREAESLYVGVRTARVKVAMDRYTARCMPPEAARILIQGTAADAVSWTDDLSPYVLDGPYTFTVEFATPSTSADVLHFRQLQRVGDRRVFPTYDDYMTAYSMFIGVLSMARSDPGYG